MTKKGRSDVLFHEIFDTKSFYSYIIILSNIIALSVATHNLNII